MDYEIHGKNDVCAIITIATDGENSSIIRNCNNQVKSLLGYSKSDLLLKDMSTVQHPVFQTAHDYALLEYLKNSKFMQESHGLLTFPTTKAGFLCPVALDARINISLNQGIEMVGLMRPHRVEDMLPFGAKFDDRCELNFMIIDSESGKMIGCSQKCGDLYGIYPHEFRVKANFEMQAQQLLKDFDKILSKSSTSRLKNSL